MMRVIVAWLLLAATTAVAADPPGEWTYPVVDRGKPAVGAKVGLILFTYPTPGEPKGGEPVFTTTDTTGEARFLMPKESAPTGRYARLLARGKDGRGGYGMLYREEQRYPPVIDLLDNTELTGRVTDEDGKPIAGLKLKPVWLGPDSFARYGGSPVSLAETPDWFWESFPPKVDDDGAFTFSGVPVSHSLAVQFEAPGYGTGRFWVLPGKPATVTLRKAGAVRLVFTKPKDAKPGDIRITLTRVAASDLLQVTAEATAKESAEVLLADLPPGQYQIGFPYSGPASVFPKAAGSVKVQSGETAVVTTPLEAAARITARFIDSKTGDGVSGATLSAQIIHGEGTSSSVTAIQANINGKLEHLVPAGAVSVIPGAPKGYAVVKFSSNRFNQFATDSVLIAPGKSHDFGTFALVKTVDVKGVVVDDAGRPVESARVQVGYSSTNSSDGKPIVTDLQGRFVIRGLNPESGVVGVTASTGSAITAAPVAIDPSKPEGELRVVVSEKYAAKVRIRAVDRTGKPILAVGVELSHSITYLVSGSGVIGHGISVRVGSTGVDGRFESAILQAGDRYTVTLSLLGFRTTSTSEWEAKPGETHDYGDVVLTRSNLAITGTVTDLAGKPVAGATVFDNADGPRPAATTTDATGRFTLVGLNEGLAFVSVRAEGFRFGTFRAEAGSAAVAFSLRRLSDPTAPPPVVSEAHNAAIAKLARHLLAAMWANRVAAGDEGKTAIRAMARLDPATARQWRDEEKVRTGGKVDLTAEIEAMNRDRDLFKTATVDPDEAIALLKPVAGNEGFRAVCKLAGRLLTDSPEQSLRIAEEAVTRARGLEEADRSWALAQAGELVFRSGKKDAGRKLIEEARKLVAPLGFGEDVSYSRCMVAVRVALYDPPSCRQMLNPLKTAFDFNPWLAQACARVAEHDLATAKAWFADFRPDNSNSKEVARQWVAYRIVRSNVDEAIAVARGIENRSTRATTLVGLADRIKDRGLAIKLIDEVVDGILADPPPIYNGGGGVTAGVLLYHAKQVGYPDLAALRDKTLAARTASTDGAFSQNTQLNQMFALSLAATDPQTAQLILLGAMPAQDRANLDGRQNRHGLVGLALADPAAAIPAVDAILARVIKAKNGYDYTGLDTLARVLAEPDQAGGAGLRDTGLIGEFEES